MVPMASIQIEQLVLEAIAQSDLRPLQKARYTRIMKSPRRTKVRQKVTDEVTLQLLEQEAIDVTPEGAMAVGSFADIIAIIIKMMPILIAFFELFG